MQRTVQKRPFGIRDKLGYLIGNLGNDFMFTFAGVFLMVFYTKVLGISSGLVGTLFVIARFLDAFTDITMGRIVDRLPPSRDGKFRPWLRRIAVPVALAGFLMYQSAVAHAPMWLRITYMFITYLIWGSVLYTAINIPYGSMASALSGDSDARAALSVARSIGSVIANLIIGVIVPLVVYETDADGNQLVRGDRFTYVSAVLAVLTVACYVTCYLLTEERVQLPAHKSDGRRLSDVVKTLVGSRALIGITVATVAILAAQLLSQSVNQYLFIDYFKSKNGAALMSAVGMIPGLVTAPFATPLARRLGKRTIGIVGSLSAALASFLLWLLRTRSIGVYIAVSVLGFLGFSLFNLIMWAIITDVIDDSEVRTGKREDGTIYGAYSFARKIGQAAAGGLGGWLLVLIGFDPTAAVQSDAVAQGIYTVATLIPALLYLVVGVSLILLYPLTKKKTEENARILRDGKQGNEENRHA
ncbi:MAG: MFS transporter [Clostridia bacterium]|nr:MFS transporter [Clostridia bacterium]